MGFCIIPIRIKCDFVRFYMKGQKCPVPYNMFQDVPYNMVTFSNPTTQVLTYEKQLSV